MEPVLIDNYSTIVDAHTRKVTEGVYTFSGRHRPANNDRDSQSRRIFQQIFWLAAISGLLIGIVGSCGVVYSVFVKLPPNVNIVPNYSQCTTSAMAPTFQIPGFNQTCSGVCSGNLLCQNNTCLCGLYYYWSYVYQMCMPCTNSNYRGAYDFCYSFWGSSATVTWIYAAGICYSVGGQISTMENYNKFAFLQTTLTHYSFPKQQLWINSTTITAKKFTWPNGDPVNPAMWYPGYPNNAGVTGILAAACVSISTVNSYFLLDQPCANNYAVFCEYYN